MWRFGQVAQIRNGGQKRLMCFQNWLGLRKKRPGGMQAAGAFGFTSIRAAILFG